MSWRETENCFVNKMSVILSLAKVNWSSNFIFSISSRVHASRPYYKTLCPSWQRPRKNTRRHSGHQKEHLRPTKKQMMTSTFPERKWRSKGSTPLSSPSSVTTAKTNTQINCKKQTSCRLAFRHFFVSNFKLFICFHKIIILEMHFHFPTGMKISNIFTKEIQM